MVWALLASPELFQIVGDARAFVVVMVGLKAPITSRYGAAQHDGTSVAPEKLASRARSDARFETGLGGLCNVPLSGSDVSSCVRIRRLWFRGRSRPGWDRCRMTYGTSLGVMFSDERRSLRWLKLHSFLGGPWHDGQTPDEVEVLLGLHCYLPSKHPECLTTERILSVSRFSTPPQTVWSSRGGDSNTSNVWRCSMC